MQPFRIYRPIEPGEAFLVGGDCSQGGSDSNAGAFFSRTKLDYPIIYKTQGVAAQMTSDIHPVLEWLFDTTGVKPVVALERNNGGASEMERLRVLNRLNKYILYTMKTPGKEEGIQDSDNLGFTTNTATRPTLLGDYKQAFDFDLIRHYDTEVISEHETFIVNRNGKPEADKNKHDDCIFASSIAYHLHQTIPTQTGMESHALARVIIRNDENRKKWSIR